MDERAPLLGTKTATGDVEAAVVRDSDGAPTEEPLAGEEPTKKTGAWTIAWYILLTVVAVVSIAFFVKAFIDADDVEVRGTKAYFGLWNTHLKRTNAIV